MIKKFLLTFGSLAIILSACTNNVRDNANPPFKHFKIAIEQLGQQIDTSGKEIFLKKEPFIITISFVGSHSIFVNASPDPAAYNAAYNKEKTANIPGFKDNDTLESLFNPDERLVISNVYPNFWNYKSKQEHRFSATEELENGVLKCTRRISNIYDADGDKRLLKLSDFKKDTLYLVFLKLEWNEDFSEKIELKRDFLKITFK